MSNEMDTNIWVSKLLDNANISYSSQGSNVNEIDAALGTASKRGTGKKGYPEYTAVVKDFVIVIEDKAELEKHIKKTDEGVLSFEQADVAGYAVNGAYFYSKHIAKNTKFKKVFAIGISGNEKTNIITPLYVDDRDCYYKELPQLDSLVFFSEKNIDEYYTHYVLNESTSEEKTLSDILADADKLHNDLRVYGSLKDTDKPLVVSGILLALDDQSFKLESMIGDSTNTDGELICQAIVRRLKSSNVGPDAKRDKLLAQFEIIRTEKRLNTKEEKLGWKTPLKYYTEFLEENVFKNIKRHTSSEDFIGRFYGEFMSYSRSDGQTLGIILTPRHICDLFCELLDLQPDDVILDPCCGTGGFLVAAMHYMLAIAGDNKNKCTKIKTTQLHGFEIQSNMFAIAVTNMILRDDGNSNILCEDFLHQNPAMVQLKSATVGMMNPPYSQGTKSDPTQYELSFVEHLLDSLTKGARAAVIVPQSSMTGKTNDEKFFKENILRHHTLKGVITCNTNTFYRVGTNPVIAVFTAHVPHEADNKCKFIDFRDDGYTVTKHVNLLEGPTAKDKRKHLLDVWNGKISAPMKFCVESTITPKDEWLHAFYYFNDEIPTESDFEKTVGDYLSFEFSMIMQNRGYLFNDTGKEHGEPVEIPALEKMNWDTYYIGDIFSILPGKRLVSKDSSSGKRPFIGAVDGNNGIARFVDDVNASLDENVLGVNYNGSIGVGFYHPYECIFSDDVKRFHLKNHEDNVYVLLFMKNVICQQASKFGYAYKFNKDRMKKTKILLPVDNTGKPDYEYMEQYIKNLMIKKRKSYSVYLRESEK